MSQVVTLYKDKEKTDALYPRTKVSAISDDNNTSLQELLNRYEVIDNLTSYETDKALSANQGRELKTLVDNKADNTTVDNLQTTVNGKANSSHTHTKSEITDFSHTHDDRYYTESEIDTKISELNSNIANAGKFYGIDTNNIIATGGADNSYTATQDSWFWLHNVDTGYITFNGKVTTNSRNDSHTAVFPLKAGDTIVPYKFQTWTSMKWYVFGVKS